MPSAAITGEPKVAPVRYGINSAVATVDHVTPASTDFQTYKEVAAVNVAHKLDVEAGADITVALTTSGTTESTAAFVANDHLRYPLPDRWR